MDLDTYQKKAAETAQYPNVGNNIIYPTLGLSGEAGEVADKVKKIIRDEQGAISDERREDIKKELGDVLWYVACLSAELGFSLNEVAETNIRKLTDRKQRGAISGSGDDR